MYKHKTHNGLRKRFKVTARGKVKYRRNFTGHLLSGKPGTRRQQLRQPGYLVGRIADNVRRELNAD